MVSTTQGGSGYFSVDAEGRLVPEVLDLKGLLGQRAQLVRQRYQPEEELRTGTIIDEWIVYTLEDRPILKEKVAELLEKRFVEKEFVKEVRLVAVKELPKSTEILGTNLTNLTADVLATNPWLGERDILATNTTVSDIAPASTSQINGTQPLTGSADDANSSKVQPETTQHGFDSTAEPIPPPRSVSPAPESFKPTAEILDSRPSDSSSTSKANGAWKNPFKAFIKNKKQSSDSRRTTPPASPQSSSTKNPFKGFVKPEKSTPKAADPALSSNGAIQLAKPGPLNKLSGRFRKGSALKWGFSQPFSGPQARSTNATDSLAPAESAQENVASKPNLEPFLDQSISNSDLGKDGAQVSDASALGSLPSDSKPVEPPPVSSRSGVSSEARAFVPTSRTQPATVSPRSSQSGPANPRRSAEVMDSVQELPSRDQIGSKSVKSANGPPNAPATANSPGSITRPVVETASYNAAIARCQATRNADMAVVGVVTPETPFRETFIQLEEYQTVHEVSQQFVEHNYYLLEHVIRTVYKGERRAEPHVELLSRERLLVTEV